MSIALMQGLARAKTEKQLAEERRMIDVDGHLVAPAEIVAVSKITYNALSVTTTTRTITVSFKVHLRNGAELLVHRERLTYAPDKQDAIVDILAAELRPIRDALVERLLQ